MFEASSILTMDDSHQSPTEGRTGIPRLARERGPPTGGLPLPDIEIARILCGTYSPNTRLRSCRSRWTQGRRLSTATTTICGARPVPTKRGFFLCGWFLLSSWSGAMERSLACGPARSLQIG